jgi:cob(I)alamin adenosyltransferase
MTTKNQNGLANLYKAAGGVAVVIITSAVLYVASAIPSLDKGQSLSEAEINHVKESMQELKTDMEETRAELFDLARDNAAEIQAIKRQLFESDQNTRQGFGNLEESIDDLADELRRSQQP